MVEQVTIVSTKAYGLEAVLGVRLLDHLRFDGNVSLVHDEFTALDITAFDHVDLLRSGPAR